MIQKYIDQLVEDLCIAAQNPPIPPYTETPPHLEESPDISELATSPFKTIEELSGISKDVFPEMVHLDADQCLQVNHAIFKVFKTLHLDLVDLPEDMPPEILYDVLTDNWRYKVQYLPSTGMDLEFCTGEPKTCPYGEYCDCAKELDEYEIPFRFETLLPRIAESIDAGFICYLNTDTLEIEDLPKSFFDDPLEFEAITGVVEEDFKIQHQDWDNYITIEPLESHESFKIMEAFAEELQNIVASNRDVRRLQDQLFYALNHKKPFANFKWKIDNSDYRQHWFDFKQQWLENYVKKEIYMNYSEQDPKEIHGGIFDDDGNPINPESVPIPSLCIICKKYQDKNQKENLLCQMTRFDQQNEIEFHCEAFEKI